MSAAEVTGSKGDLPEDRNPHYYTGRAAAREVRAEHTGPLRLGSSKNLLVLQNTRERFTNDHSSVQETPNHLLLHWRRAPIHTPCDEILPGNETGHSGTCLGEEPAKR